MCLYLVPGPVGSVSSIMDTTWAVISWSVPSYIPQDYPIITYEIGYHILQSDNCTMTKSINFDPQTLKFSSNVSSFTNITGLNESSCYIFGVRAYTVKGHGNWKLIANETSESPSLPIVTITYTVTSTSGIEIIAIEAHIIIISISYHFF